MSSAQTLNDLMMQLQNLESSVTTVLMEAVIKMAALTDANFFMMVETREGRRFAGKRHLCDAYVDGQLVPIGEDYEIEVDPAVTSMKMSRVDNQRHRSPISLTHHSPGSHHYASAFETLLPRKRGRQDGPSSSAGNNKSRRLSPSLSFLPATGADSSDVVCVAGDVKVEVDDLATADATYTENKDGGNDMEEVVDSGTMNPDDSSPSHRSHNEHNDHKQDSMAGSRSRIADVAIEASFQRPLAPTRPQQQYSPFPPNDSISEILEGPFPASEALEAKIAACEVYSSAPLTADSPETDVAMKIIKSTFYDISKVIAAEFVSVLRSRCLSPESDPKQFLRARLNVVLNAHPALQSISSTPDFKAWDYTRTNFTCIVKRLMKVKRMTTVDLSSALDQEAT